MQTAIGIIVLVFFTVLFILALRWKRSAVAKVYEDMKEKPHSYTLVIDEATEIHEANFMILNLDSAARNFTQADLAPSLFKISVNLKDYYTQRTVKAAYPCDIDGNKVDFDSGFTHLLLELNPVSDEEKALLDPVEKNIISVSHIKFNGNIFVANEPLYQSNSPYSQPM